MPTSKPIRVLLLDDHLDIGKNIQKQILKNFRSPIINQTGNCLIAKKWVNQHQYDLVVLGIDQIHQPLTDFVTYLKVKNSKQKLLILSTKNEEKCASQLSHLGVKGYLTDQISQKGLNEALHQVMIGESVIAND